MAFYLACPGKVFLNRGNHEDRHTCASYGFEREVGRKCTKQIFETINSVFIVLPICTIVDKKVEKYTHIRTLSGLAQEPTKQPATKQSTAH